VLFRSAISAELAILPEAHQSQAEGRASRNASPPFCLPLGDCVVTSKTSSLSFRPQGEILDPSHSFGMTTRSWAIATQSPAGEDKGGAGLFPSHLHPVPSNALRTGLSPSSGKERCRMCTNVKITLCIVSRQNACSLIFHVTTHSTFLPSFCATPMKCRPFRGSVPSSDRDASHR
jgi:hypothetical protein